MKKIIEKHFINYVGTITHTSTKLENNTEFFFKEYFENLKYFEDNPDKWGLYPIEGDHLNRHVPWGLLKGEGDETIIMIHHSDTVDTDDYGIHKDMAYDPYKITEIFKEGKVYLNEDAKKDLDSGDWLFGRGVADMKGGAAIQLALLEEYSKEENFKGNLILLGVPDEENLSAGMRGAIPLLKELKEKYNLKYTLMLNVEPHTRREAHRPVVYDGSIGKLMPFFYVRGKLTHVGDLYEGFNPINLLSNIIKNTELNTDFVELVGNSYTPPPTWLYSKDVKQVYDVSLPLAAVGYMNLLTLDRAPKEIFDQLYSIANQSFIETIEYMENSYKEYQKIIKRDLGELGWQPNTKLYGDLYKEAVKDSGDAFIEDYNKLIQEIKSHIAEDKLTIVKAVIMIIEKTLEYVKDLSPMVVIALAPPYYPNVHNSMVPEKTSEIQDGLDEVLNFAKAEWGQEYYLENYFPGISDLSYAVFESDKENISYIEENMLLWKDVYYIPLEDIKELSVPVFNVGPWGKDAHKYSERVYKEDLFERTPIVVDRLIRKVLGQEMDLNN